MGRHFTKIRDLSREEANRLLARAKWMKNTRHSSSLLAGKTLVLLFEKASTRTRLSFEVGIRQLGGQTIFMTPAESQLGRSEPLKDTARIISRYNDGMVVRTFGQATLDQLIAYGSVPVINALTDEGHPCQVMGDLLTSFERTPDFSSLKLAWVGDGNNMANSWIEAAIYFPFQLTLACPEGYDPHPGILEDARKAGARVRLIRDPAQALAGADYVNTDVWASMGQEGEEAARRAAFASWRIDADMMRLAAPGAKFMHCLPAHRGEEMTEEVFEGPASIVFDQAENRLHMQKAILEWVFSPPESAL
jgi:ornithine carbamoyltransferase